MSIEIGYTFVRDNYNTVGLPPEIVTTLEVGAEATDTVFRAWTRQFDICQFMGERCSHYRGFFWPNLIERGYRLVVVEYENPDDLENPGLPPSYRVPDPIAILTRADVVDEMAGAEIYAVCPLITLHTVTYAPNYYGARNSLGELMG
jgi:hypothetical protein